MLHQTTIQLPTSTYRRLLRLAESSNRTVSDVVDDLVETVDPLPVLPPEVIEEMTALQALSDDALLTLVSHPLPFAQQQELATLNEKAQAIGLSDSEEKRQAMLGELANRAILRRAHCIDLLQKRGHALGTMLVRSDEQVI